MRRNRRRYITDVFYTTGDMNARTVDDSFGFSRQFTDTMNQEMMEEERLERKHKLEREQKQETHYPSCDLNDRPTTI